MEICSRFSRIDGLAREGMMLCRFHFCARPRPSEIRRANLSANKRFNGNLSLDSD